jgi:hypothetical protein
MAFWSRCDEGNHVTTRRRIGLAFFGALVLAGAYDAVRNLPVLSGCYFYAECPEKATDAPSSVSADASRES